MFEHNSRFSQIILLFWISEHGPLKHKYSLSNIMTTTSVLYSFISEKFGHFSSFLLLFYIVWWVFSWFFGHFLDFLKHFLWLDLEPEPWTQPLKTINYLFSTHFLQTFHSLFLIFWVQDKGHFKIYIHLFVCIENQCYCQAVIQSYPFASI